MGHPVYSKSGTELPCRQFAHWAMASLLNGYGADLVVEADSGTGDALAGLLYDVVEAAVTGNSR